MTEPELCADAIAHYGDDLVLVERNTEPKGLALPGGRVEPGETRRETVMREMYEEAGLHFDVETELDTYDAPERDPRGHKISTVFTGNAYGDIGGEDPKTDVILQPHDELEDIKEELVFDHAEILQDYIEDSRGNRETTADKRAVKEPDDLFLLHDGTDEYAQYTEFNDLNEAQQAYASHADGILGATLPVDEHHPAVNEDIYVITAKFEKTYRTTYYDGSSDRKTKTWYTAEKAESKSAIQDTIDSFVTDEPEWVKVGAAVDLI